MADVMYKSFKRQIVKRSSTPTSGILSAETAYCKAQGLFMAGKLEKQRMIQELEGLIIAHVAAGSNAGPDGYQQQDQDVVDAMRGALETRLDELLPSSRPDNDYKVIDADGSSALEAKLKSCARDGWRLHNIVVQPRSVGHALVAVMVK